MMCCTRVVIVALMASLFVHQGLYGQKMEELKGETLRASVRGADDEVRGTLLELRGDTLVLSDSSSRGEVDIPRSMIVQLERRVLERRHWTGLWQGSTLGAAGGLIYGTAVDCTHHIGFFEAFCSVFYTGLGALGGGLAGLAIGATIESEEWIDVPVELEAGPTPGGGAGLVLTIPIGT